MDEHDIQTNHNNDTYGRWQGFGRRRKVVEIWRVPRCQLRPQEINLGFLQSTSRIQNVWIKISTPETTVAREAALFGDSLDTVCEILKGA